MASLSDVRKAALALPGVSETAYHSAKFQVGSKGFAAYWAREDVWVFKLPPARRDILFEVRPEIFRPYRSGAMLWSFVDLAALTPAESRELVTDAWTTVAPKRVSQAFLAKG